MMIWTRKMPVATDALALGGLAFLVPGVQPESSLLLRIRPMSWNVWMLQVGHSRLRGNDTLAKFPRASLVASRSLFEHTLALDQAHRANAGWDQHRHFGLIGSIIFSK
jgi:hypothetical protein